MAQENIVFVDVETSGMSPSLDRIIEIGLIRVENNKIVSEYSKLINPESPIPWYISRITGLTDSHVKDSPIFDTLASEILPLLENATFVAHNVEFDYGFIRGEFKRLDIDYNSDRFCTVQLSRAIYPHQIRHNLDKVTELHGINIKNRHRAFDDAYALWEFYKIIRDKYSPTEFQNILNRITKHTNKRSNKISSQYSFLD